MFERYDWRAGCMAVRKDDRWYVAIPNGDGILCASETDAREQALFINATADQEERDSWR